MLRRLILISIDLLLVAFATVLAVVLRGNFDTVQEALIILMPYMFISIGCAFIVFLVGGLDRTPWRYSSVADHLQIIMLTVLVILLTLGLTFAANRLEGVARSLPVMQGGIDCKHSNCRACCCAILVYKTDSYQRQWSR